MNKEIFCCADISFHISNNELHFRYCSRTRCYSIDYLEKTGGGSQVIHFCPWCGTKLPNELNDELADIIFDELKLLGYDDPNLPDEFKTDEWWKKRGL